MSGNDRERLATLAEPSPPRLPLLLTIGAFSALVGWSESATRHRIERGQLPGVRRIGGRVYLRRDEVLPFVLEGRGQSRERSR
jgi:hypothetical protein